jgi:uncharacterized protein (TIGR02246 family)
MDPQGERLVSEIISELEKAWNAADGAGFARTFAENADFVNIRGEYFRTREAIARGHQVIFDTIYKDSKVHYQRIGMRVLAAGVLLAHVKSTLSAPSGPLAGEHNSVFTIVVVQDQEVWRIAAFHNTLVVKEPR